MFTQTGQLPDDYLEDLIRRHRAGLVTFALPNEVGLRRFASSPSVLEDLRSRLGTRSVLAVFDLAYAYIRTTIAERARAADLVVSIDLPSPIAESMMPGCRVLGLWTVPDPELFFDDGGRRDIPVSFVGDRGAHPERQAVLAEPKTAVIDVLVAGSKGEAHLDNAGYGALLRRSLMTINIPSKWAGAGGCACSAEGPRHGSDRQRRAASRTCGFSDRAAVLADAPLCPLRLDGRADREDPPLCRSSRGSAGDRARRRGASRPAIRGRKILGARGREVGAACVAAELYLKTSRVTLFRQISWSRT